MQQPPPNPMQRATRTMYSILPMNVPGGADHGAAVLQGTAARTAANPGTPIGRMLYRVRRRVATAAVIALALVFAYHAIFGQNGITAYAQKRSEDRVLAAEIDRLQTENAQLKLHVEHLKDDPDAIEREARERLHYTHPNEVIYTLDDRAQPDAHAPDDENPAKFPPTRPPSR